MTESTTEPDIDPALQENPAAHKTPGALIHEARTRLEYSLDDLAHETRLFKSTLHQLELDEYRELPQPPLAAGYYRQCARALGLDEDQIAAACREHAGAALMPRVCDTKSAMGVAPADVTPRGPRRLPRLLLLLLLLVALAAAGVTMLLPSMSLSGGDSDAGAVNETVLSVNDPVSTDESAAAPTAGAANSGANQASVASVSSNGRGSSKSNRPDKANPEASSNVDRVAQSGKAKAGDGSQSTDGGAADGNRSQGQSFITPPTGGRKVAAIFGDPNSMVATALAVKRQREAAARSSSKTSSVPPNRLKLQFDEKCWVRLTDANGNRLFMGTFQAGDSRVFEAKLPYHLTLGFAPGAKVWIGGQSVEITSGGVAHLTIAAPEETSTYG